MQGAVDQQVHNSSKSRPDIEQREEQYEEEEREIRDSSRRKGSRREEEGRGRRRRKRKKIQYNTAITGKITSEVLSLRQQQY